MGHTFNFFSPPFPTRSYGVPQHLRSSPPHKGPSPWDGRSPSLRLAKGHAVPSSQLCPRTVTLNPQDVATPPAAADSQMVTATVVQGGQDPSSTKMEPGKQEAEVVRLRVSLGGRFVQVMAAHAWGPTCPSASLQVPAWRTWAPGMPAPRSLWAPTSLLPAPCPPRRRSRRCGSTWAATLLCRRCR